MIESEIINVQVFPMSMTGKKLRKVLGIPSKKDLRLYGEKSWRVCAKFRGIKRRNRLTFLRKMAKTGDPISLSEIKKNRNGFNQNKIHHLPMNETCPCYACPDPENIRTATVRHHVVLLSKGGRNKRNNIVPLCNECHVQLHPHMQKSGRIASRDCKPKINGPLDSLHKGEMIVFVARQA